VTLIASVSTGDEFVLISDVLVSTSPELKASDLYMPLHIGPVTKDFTQFGLSRMGQKMTIVDDIHCFQTAGISIVAESVVSEFARSIQEMQDIERFKLREWLNSLGYLPKELSGISLIYHQHHRTLPMVYRVGHNCKYKETKTEKIYYSGSGSFDFIENWEQQDARKSAISLISGWLSRLRTGETRLHPIIENWFSRVGYMIVSETSTLGSGPLDFAYGGWFEIGASYNSKFSKVPYLTKFWTIQGGSVTRVLPAILCSYIGHHLVITRVDPLGRQGGVTTLHYAVEDTLRRQPLPSNEQIHARQAEAWWQIHIVFQMDIPGTIIIIRNGSNPKVQISRNRDGWQIDFDRSFDEVLLRTRSGQSRTGIIGRPYD
jgi:hypothetical protein